MAELFHTAFYLVGNMGYNLHRLSQIVAAALLVNDALVDASGGHVVGAGGAYVGEAFVVSQVKVGLMAVYGHVAFSMLIRVERSRINVDVGVEFLDGYFKSPCYQQIGKR